MHEDRPAFGQRLAELAELGVIEFRPEPLDAIVERRLKAIWEERSCPHCGADSLHALTGSDRIWCGRCDWKTTYTRGTPFYDSELTPGEFLIAFILYADTLLSITQIAALLSPCFTDDVVEPFIAENAPRYPQRTVTQLHDLSDDIQTIAGMSDQQENDQEKIALYLDHYDAIKDVTDTFDDRWDAFTGEWGLRLAETLEDQGIGTYTETSENVVTVRLDPEEATRGEWLFRSSSSDWGMIFKHGWYRHTETLEPPDACPDDGNDARIGFHHRLGRNRDLAIGDHTLNAASNLEL